MLVPLRLHRRRWIIILAYLVADTVLAPLATRRGAARRLRCRFRPFYFGFDFRPVSSLAAASHRDQNPPHNRDKMSAHRRGVVSGGAGWTRPRNCLKVVNHRRRRKICRILVAQQRVPALFFNGDKRARRHGNFAVEERAKHSHEIMDTQGRPPFATSKTIKKHLFAVSPSPYRG